MWLRLWKCVQLWLAAHDTNHWQHNEKDKKNTHNSQITAVDTDNRNTVKYLLFPFFNNTNENDLTFEQNTDTQTKYCIVRLTRCGELSWKIKLTQISLKNCQIVFFFFSFIYLYFVLYCTLLCSVVWYADFLKAYDN